MAYTYAQWAWGACRLEFALGSRGHRVELILEIAGDQIDGARDYQEDAFLTTFLDDESAERVERMKPPDRDVGLEHFADAEELLLDSHRGLMALDATANPSLKRHRQDAMKGLIHLYEVWPEPEKAARWRDKLESQASNSE